MREKKNLEGKPFNWKKQTAKITITLALGVGIGWGFFSNQTNDQTKNNHTVVSDYHSFTDSAEKETQKFYISEAEKIVVDHTVVTMAGISDSQWKETQKSYISETEAEKAAADHAGVIIVDISDPQWIQTNSSKEKAIMKKCKLDLENGIMVYEIEFYTNGYEHDYTIHAVTGEILSFEKEKDNTYTMIQMEQSSGTQAAEGVAYIEKSKAREIAYTHANVEKDAVYPRKCELDKENGIVVYKVKFFSFDGYEYEYKINAVTGEIISNKREQDAHYTAILANQNGKFGDTTIYISLEEAEFVAVSHSGVEEYKLLDYEIDEENGVVVYEIEFAADGYQYDYEIQAATGKVISYEKKLENKKGQNIGIGNNVVTESQGNSQKSQDLGSSTITFISEADARTIAVQHAGITNSNLFVECELKSKNGSFLYEVEFKTGGFEYEYKINAVTAEIISFEKEWDD